MNPSRLSLPSAVVLKRSRMLRINLEGAERGMVGDLIEVLHDVVGIHASIVGEQMEDVIRRCTLRLWN